jgi:hypothetical protein
MHALPTTEAVGLSLFGVMTLYMVFHYWSSRYSGLTWRIQLGPSQTEGIGWGWMWAKPFSSRCSGVPILTKQVLRACPYGWAKCTSLHNTRIVW